MNAPAHVHTHGSHPFCCLVIWFVSCSNDGNLKFLTKGDNNRVDDRGLYAPGQQFIGREDILGRAVGTLRYVGMVTIILNDYPALKYVLVAVMGLFVLTNKE